ncbi:MAG: preprotein translocase subunit SecG [bacterium]|nr:preprotein translocase subunit SecG [bacterium]
MLETILTIAQAVLGALLILTILLQARGTGLGAAFGGDGAVFHERRGAEKKLHQMTIAIAIIFFGVALAQALS